MQTSVDRVLRELRHGARRLARAPIFTLATTLTLALAIGANVAIFTVVQRVVLNPLPYGDSGRLVAIDHGFPSRNVASGVPLTSELYFQYLDRARAVNGLAVYRTDEITLTGDGVPERIRVAHATASLAPVLRVSPEWGRWFTEDQSAPGAAPVAVLSHGLWIRRYAGNPGVVGRRITLDGRPTAVVGVMPASFGFPDPRIDAWIPAQLSRAKPDAAYVWSAVGRLRGGKSPGDVRGELTRLANDLAPASPNNGYDRLVCVATTLIEATVGRIAQTLWILLASVGLVLLIACANVANLFLARSEAKQREVAVRRALGAGAGGIATYFFAESAWLAAAAGGIGLMLAWTGIRMLVAFGPANLPRLSEVQLDPLAVAFTIALAVTTGALFGAIPLLRLGPLAIFLRESGRGSTASRGRHLARQLLMGGQVALALVLLIASALMLRSFQKMRAVDSGFDPLSALTFRVGLPPMEYPNREKMVAAHAAILDRLSTVPGVVAASAAACLPLSEQGCIAAPLFVEGRIQASDANPPFIRFNAVAGGFFSAMGTRLVRGRAIERSDVERAEPVVVINEALATLAFPNQDPIGRRVRAGNPALVQNPGWLTIVGVVANTSYRALTATTPVPQMYMPMVAPRLVNIIPAVTSMSYLLRTATPPESLVTAARRAVNDVDSRLALAQVLSLQDIVDRSSAQMAFTMVLLLIAGVVALLLGVIGIYGVMSYIVSQRTAEIGVRLALGARPAGVVAMIVKQGATVAAIGTFVGLGTALAGSRVIESLLYGVSPRDPVVFGGTALALFAIALLASWLPARRAAILNPLDALRSD